MESAAEDSQPWNRLDDIVQLSYTVTGVDIIYSQYNDTTWHLHILSDQNKYYYVQYQGETQLEKLMVRTSEHDDNIDSPSITGVGEIANA